MGAVHDRHPALPDDLDQTVAIGQHASRQCHPDIGACIGFAAQCATGSLA